MSRWRVAGVTLVISGLVPGWSLAGPRGSQDSHRRNNQGMFMDLLMGGPRAAEAAARVDQAVGDVEPRELQAQVSTKDGRTVREYTLVIQEKVLDYGGADAGRIGVFVVEP